MGQSLVHGDNQQKTVTSDLQWLAGIIDSEGSVIARVVGHNKSKILIHTRVSNCEMRLIDEVSRILDGLSVVHGVYHKIDKRVRNKECFELVVSGFSSNRKILTSIIPFLIGKRLRAELALEVVSNRLSNQRTPITARELECIKMIVDLNSKGVTASQRLLTKQEDSLDPLMRKSDLTGNSKNATEMFASSPEWLGGFIDGDGCVSLNLRDWKGHKHFVPSITITNTDHANLIEVCRLYKCNMVAFYVNARKINTSHKPSWAIEIQGHKRCDKALRFIQPYLKIKISQANLLNSFLQSRLSKLPTSPITEHEMECWKKIKQLNLRGK